MAFGGGYGLLRTVVLARFGVRGGSVNPCFLSLVFSRANHSAVESSAHSCIAMALGGAPFQSFLLSN